MISILKICQNVFEIVLYEGKKMKIVLKYPKNKYITMNIKLKIKVYTGKKYKTYYDEYNQVKKELKENLGDEKEKQRKLDLLQYQINEIEEAISIYLKLLS